MRWRVLFLISLGVNLVLAGIWLTVAPGHPLARGVAAELAVSNNATVKTNVLLRRQFFSWAEIESPDYPTFIANLRNIACPEQTIRDIIIADINALFARRISMDVLTPDQQWWRSEPDPEIAAAAEKRLHVLEVERRVLLTQLLGISWESGDLVSLPRPSRPALTLDGPVLGALPSEVKQIVQEASARATDRLDAYLEAQRLAGRKPDPAEIAKLRQQTREELSRILTPPQIEEFLLRYSQGANDLRARLGELKYFEASPDEFRAIFRATDSVDQQIELLTGKQDANSVLQRNQLLQQREDALKTALGTERYSVYRFLQDPLFRDAIARAEQAGTPEAAQKIYEVNLAMAQHLNEIRANTNLTADQRAIALKQAELEQLKANAQVTGQEVAQENPPASTVSTQQNALVPATRPYVLGIAESAASVARQYGVSLSALQAANPGIDFRRLRPGDSIRVPGPILTPATPQTLPPLPPLRTP
jgi:hypothetical protein